MIVGNGSSLLQKQLGATIDTFMNIVRFNGYVVKGFEMQVGKRTTIWSRSYRCPAMQETTQLDSVWVNMPLPRRTMENVAEAYRLLGRYAGSIQIIPTLEVATSLQRRLFGDHDLGRWPSSGLLAIAHAIDQGFDVWIAGIDCWEREPYHYYGHHDRSDTHHVADREAECVASWISDGAVNVLG